MKKRERTGIDYGGQRAELNECGRVKDSEQLEATAGRPGWTARDAVEGVVSSDDGGKDERTHSQVVVAGEP
jgi:hypothetical protein